MNENQVIPTLPFYSPLDYPALGLCTPLPIYISISPTWVWAPWERDQCVTRPGFQRAQHGTWNSLNICWMNEERNKPQLVQQVAQCPVCPRNSQDSLQPALQARKGPPCSAVTCRAINILQAGPYLYLQARCPPRGLWSRASFKEVKSLYPGGLQGRLKREGWRDGPPGGAAPRAKLEISLSWG